MKVASMPDECVIRRSGDCQFPVSTERNVINRCKCGQFTDNEFCRMIAGICKSYKRNGSSGRTRTYNPPVNSRVPRVPPIDSIGTYNRMKAAKPLCPGGLAGSLAVRRVPASRRNSNTLIMAFGSSAVGRAESTLAGITDAYWHDRGLRSAGIISELVARKVAVNHRRSCRQSGTKST